MAKKKRGTPKITGREWHYCLAARAGKKRSTELNLMATASKIANGNKKKNSGKKKVKEL